MALIRGPSGVMTRQVSQNRAERDEVVTYMYDLVRLLQFPVRYLTSHPLACQSLLIGLRSLVLGSQ